MLSENPSGIDDRVTAHPAVDDAGAGSPAADIDPSLLRRALGSFATGLTVVTTLGADGELHGLTANAFSSLSLEPPLVLVCVSYRARSYLALVEGGSFVVHILAKDQAGVGRGFADRGARKSTVCPWHVNERGFAILDRFHAAFECSLHAEYPGGDHAILVGRVERVLMHDPGSEPLVYYRGRMLALGEPVADDLLSYPGK
jgi:3-hydroxy-9,10-secoandrosta-1,3,5(10)-triene-9,17-dione monooxygenase reductase component